jgi:hypothetical protein
LQPALFKRPSGIEVIFFAMHNDVAFLRRALSCKTPNRLRAAGPGHLAFHDVQNTGFAGWIFQ